MAVYTNYIPRLLASLNDKDTKFSITDGATEKESTVISGGFSVDSFGFTAFWTGGSVEITASEAMTVDGLRCRYDSPLDPEGVLFQMPFTAIPLSAGETITFTNIEVSYPAVGY